MTRNLPSRCGGLACLIFTALPALAQREVEALDRGLVAIRQAEGKVYLGWRLIGTEPEKTAFNLYRNDRSLRQFDHWWLASPDRMSRIQQVFPFEHDLTGSPVDGQ